MYDLRSDELILQSFATDKQAVEFHKTLAGAGLSVQMEKELPIAREDAPEL
jgi:hypothetical protein